MSFVLWIALTAFAAERTCTPSCDTNEVCTATGKCVTPCIPPCEGDAKCNSDGKCVGGTALGGPIGTPNVGASSPNVGGATLCVERTTKDTVQRVTWSVLIDGRVAGGVAGGTEACFDTEPGRQTVVVMYNDPSTGAKSRAEKTVQIAPGGTVKVAVASSGKNIVFK